MSWRMCLSCRAGSRKYRPWMCWMGAVPLSRPITVVTHETRTPRPPPVVTPAPYLSPLPQTPSTPLTEAPALRRSSTKRVDAVHLFSSSPPPLSPTTAICSRGSLRRAVRGSKCLTRWCPASQKASPFSPVPTKTR